MDKSKIEHLNKQEYTHLPHAEQDFEAHEQTDVAIRPLVWTLAILAAVVGVTYIGMVGVFMLFDTMAQKSPDNPKLTNVDSGVRHVPEGYPALQGVPALEANPNTPGQDMEELRERNEAVMSGQKGIRADLKPGMPIDRAIDEALSRKIFKTRAGGEAGKGATDAGGAGAAGSTRAPAGTGNRGGTGTGGNGAAAPAKEPAAAEPEGAGQAR